MQRHSRLLVGAVLTAAIFAACGGSQATTAPASTPSTASPAMTDHVSAAPSSTTGGSTAAPMTDGGAAGPRVIVVRDFELDPASVSVAGDTIAFEVRNEGPTVHNVKVRDQAGITLFGSRDLREGESETVMHEIAPGTYDLYCSLPGHESLGIKGTLTVAAP